MTFLLLILLGVAVWGWRGGYLKAIRSSDLAAAGVAIVGLAMLGRGNATVGLAALAGAGLWAAWRSRRSPRPTGKGMDAAEARDLLDLPHGADAAAIRSSHRRLIARVHPDVGGSPALARRVTAARDILLAELNRGIGKASSPHIPLSKEPPR